MDLTEKKQAEELVYDGTLLKIWRTKVILADGTFLEWINYPSFRGDSGLYRWGHSSVRQFRPIGRKRWRFPPVLVPMNAMRVPPGIMRRLVWSAANC